MNELPNDESSTNQPAGTVLIVDDEAPLRTVLAALLEQAGMDVIAVGSGTEALALLPERPIDVVVSDLRMPRMDGLTLLSAIKRDFPEIPVIVLTAHGTVQTAVEAMQKGAADFITKPFDREEVVYAVRRALATARASERHFEPVISQTLLGRSAAMQDTVALLAKVAQRTSTVLLRGESGTGKELAARAIHDASSRRDRPLVAVHCAALPDTLLESELFGYEKGAFTGATQRKPGRVELAEGGTLFLDEIGEVPLAIQPKLLRLLQEREYVRVGGTQVLRADVRFVAATHRDLEAMVREGTFREDLFYRLNVVPIELPPLRDRQDDIPLLVEHIAKRIAKDDPTVRAQFDAEAIAHLQRHDWPGNVRELANFVERLVILSDGPIVTSADVERELTRRVGRVTPLLPQPSADAFPEGDGSVTLDVHVQRAEREALVDALRRTGNNRTQTARLLGVSRRTLYNKLTEHGLI